METILRAWAMYCFLLVVFRLAGKRTLSEATAFDLVLLLIISETTQQAMVKNDHSITNGFLLVLTLVGTDILFSLLKQWFPMLDPLIEGTAVILVRDGELLRERMERERVDVSDILEAARLQSGLSELGQIRLAVLERSGKISVVAR